MRLLRSVERAAGKLAGHDINVSLAVKWNSTPSFDLARCVCDAAPSIVDLTVLPGYGNVGFGRAHNALAAMGFERGARYYLCLNPDGVLHRNCLVELMAFAAAQERPALIEARQFPREHPKPYDPLTGETAWCAGAALLIPRKIFETVGGFDENFFMYCEDVDLSWRVREAGLSTLLCPTSLFGHDIREKKSPQIQRLMLEAGRYLAAKWAATQFQEHIEKQLVIEGFYPDVIYLPPLPAYQQRFTTPGLQEWRQLLSFAVPRW
jgi:GT2 family glycosyltransferase